MAGTFELTLRGEFSAAHRIRLYDGGLEPLHGHNWRVEIDLAGAKLDAIGVVADFVMLERQLETILAGYHDCFLNEHADLSAVNPTTENVACAIAKRVGEGLPAAVRLKRVRVWETSNCAASYLPG